MENCSFQSQLLSVMEVLAKAAVAEINRRVDDSCALLRLEVSQSRQDINLLKRKCEVMEAELKRSRMRARRKVFNLPTGGRFTPVVKVVLDKESLNADWDRQMDTEAPNQQQQRADLQPADEAEHIQIKEECAEENTWKNDSEDKTISEAEQLPCFEASQSAHTASFGDALFSPADGYNTFPEQQLPRDQDETELVVKCEKEEQPDENRAPINSGHVAEEAGPQLWTTSACRDAAAEPSVSYPGQQIPTAFTPQTGQHLEDIVPRVLSVSTVGKPHSLVATAARVRRRARTFGYKRPQPDEGHGALSQINSINPSLIPQQSQHQYRDATVHTRNTGEDLRSCCSSFSLARRMRPSWRSSLGEKRFCCTYCDKSFTRFSQLKEHLRSHTGEKPFSCMQCGRSFTKQCNLIRHAVVHSGEKPYECSLCGKCFTQRSSLTSHQKTAH
ncbi:zinc finger protein 436 [Parambassis ranga]|uniref:Zinc finger protein 436 n=1 Tax=Parambassis ranga TaxID=210632 RepID=A0A6P7K1E6_9TELE|nr:zinc finger protein 436-like [Parambassis ranga]